MVVDVGANYGVWIESVLKCASPEKVIAFEPDPTALRILKSKYEGRDSVQIVEAAVGADDGSVTFNVAGSSKLSSVLNPDDRLRGMYGDDAETARKINVRMVGLDNELSGIEDISIVKIDVQGYELNVLNGAEEILQRTDYLLVELNWTRKYEEGGHSRKSIER
jgi:FkbM family methyltransferase